jgi:hypothetical protein
VHCAVFAPGTKVGPYGSAYRLTQLAYNKKMYVGSTGNTGGPQFENP